MQVCEGAGELRAPTRARLHLDADRPPASRPDEIDLGPRGRAIVREGPANSRVSDLRAQLVEHQRFEQGPALGGVKRLPQAAGERARYPAVEEIELTRLSPQTNERVEGLRPSL